MCGVLHVIASLKSAIKLIASLIDNCSSEDTSRAYTMGLDRVPMLHNISSHLDELGS